MKKKYTPKQIGIMAVFVSFGFVLQYTESKIFISAVPGGKLGLCNIVSIINIFIFGGQNALVIASIRSMLTSFITGGAATLPYSLAGAVCSTAAMWLVKKYFYPKISIIGISIAGAAVHNIAQLVVAFLQYGSGYVFSYLPSLLTVALISGTVTGYATRVLAERLLKERCFK